MKRTAPNVRNTYGGYRPRHIETDPEQAARDVAAGRTAALAEIHGTRLEHPVITVPRWTTPYRVLRRVRTTTGFDLELIGETKTFGEGLDIARTERWAAIVVDDHGRQVHFNHQPEKP